MTGDPIIDEIVKHYEELVVKLDDPEIVATALKLGYYVAMLDAAKHDPLDDPEEAAVMEKYFIEEIASETETFQTLVNAKL